MAVHAESFARLVASTSKLAGIPQLRHAFVPSPVGGRTPTELRAYIEGPNPITGHPFIDDMMFGLTGALTEEDMKGVKFERVRPRLLEPGTEDELRTIFLENGWTDYLPIILPTEGRVAAMLAGTSHDKDEPAGKIRATGTRDFWEFTVEQAAVNAVMAGAQPEHFPTILALLTSGITARWSSMSSAAVMVLINGPIRHELQMNSGIGALSQYNLANSVIGRSYGLGSQNLQGGSVPAISYMGTIGNPMNLVNMCVAENEEDSPWEPYHVQRGFKESDSVATVYTGVRSLPRGASSKEGLAKVLESFVPGWGAFFLIDPLVARNLIEREGVKSKEELSAWLADRSYIPAGRWWATGLQDVFFGARARQGVEPYATYLQADPEELIRLNEPQDIHFGVVGGRVIPDSWAVEGHPSSFGNNAKVVSIDKWR
ncbi:MAG: UGSC family (seleno)protein [Acidimicrobiales bacterium]